MVNREFRFPCTSAIRARELGRQKRPARKAQFVEVRAVASERIEIAPRNGRRVIVPATIEPRVAAAFAGALEEAGW